MTSISKSNLTITKKDSSSIDSLFESFSVKNINFRNRILAPPITNDQADIDGRVTLSQLKHYRTLARQGVGTIIVESAYVTKQGRSHFNQLGISEEDHLEGLENLARGVKQEGSAIGIRITHAGAQTAETICGEQPIGPSVLNFGRDYDVSREFDQGDVEEIILNFVHAAERAEEVGMDFIEINGAEQHLLDQCCNVKYNSRFDEYGASNIDTRIRLAIEIVKAIKNRKSVNLPMSYYFSVFDKIEDGFKPKDLDTMINALEIAGINFFHPYAVHAMNKCFENRDPLCQWTSKFTKCPIIINGNLKSPQLLEEASELDCADWFALDQSIFDKSQWYQFLKRKLNQ